MTATTHDIYDIAEQFARLFPSDVDATVSAWGHREAGYQAHHADGDTPGVGYYYAGGQCGHPVMSFAADDIDAAYAAMGSLPVQSPRSDLAAVESALTAAGVRYERLV